MTDVIHGEFESLEHRSTIRLVERMTAEAPAFAGIDPPRELYRAIAKWCVEWVGDTAEIGDHLEVYPSEKEARIRFINLLAQNGVSP